MRTALVLGVVIGVSLGLQVQAQEPPTLVPTFEISSVKFSQAAGLEYAIGVDVRRSRVRATNASLVSLLIWAYGIGPKQIVGGPEWIDGKSERFDVEGQAPKTGKEYSRDDILRMLQPLLAERFKLTFHREGDAFVIDHAELPAPN